MSALAGFFLHFYQPPRENPWLGLTPNEWSAWPYHDWNERVTAECYRAMTAVALTPGEDSSVELFEPLPASSFDVGPTLHHWLATNALDVDRSFCDQVRHRAPSPEAAAFAAPLAHVILPLAREQDRALLIDWGIADYRQRFGRAPTGFWLPETAVDLATLEAIARAGIRYTVLMPQQAARVRPLDGTWREVDAASLDTTRAYLVRLSEGRSITVLFGHADLSQRVAFGDLLANGSRLADTMMDRLGGRDDGAVVLVADGETYGHHHRFGELGLAWALRRLERHYHVETSPGEWLAAVEPRDEVELAAVSSWSCAHGVERWRSDCGCTTGSQPGWNQAWRAPLREALDWLSATLAPAVDERLGAYVDSPEATVRDYGAVLATSMDRDDFIRAHAARELRDEEVARVLSACEIRRLLLYSFTSCAWFFADASDIETAIVLRYAALAMDLAERAFGLSLAAPFAERLAPMRSNRPGLTSATIWAEATEPYRVDAALVAAGFAVELLAHPFEAKRVRGDWRVTPDDEDPSLVHVVHTPTASRSRHRVRATRTGVVSTSVEVADPDEATGPLQFALDELGDDLVARVSASWLVEPGSVDYEGALDRLVAEILAGATDRAAAAALVALAGAPRCVSPMGEASIRRALLALRAHNRDVFDAVRLSPLALAVGLTDLAATTRDAESASSAD